MDIVLIDIEQTLIDRTAKEAMDAARVASDAAKRALETEEEAKKLGSGFQAAVNVILQLKGLNPADHVASYDEATGRVIIRNPALPDLPPASPTGEDVPCQECSETA